MQRKRFLVSMGLALGAAAILTGVGTPGQHPNRAVAASGVVKTMPIHPLLQVGAQVEPDKKVRVLVTRTDKGHSARDIARSAAGDVDEDFDFVKTHVMTIPQKAVFALAKNPHVAYISPDGDVVRQAAVIDDTKLITLYPAEVTAPSVWNARSAVSQATGKGVKVAVLDTGVNPDHPDFTGSTPGTSRVQLIKVNSSATTGQDKHGHGTHVAGIIAGKSNDGKYIGVAPDATIISIKVADDTGVAHESDLLRGMQWIYDNRAASGIKVVNLSVSSATKSSYKTSPIAAAAEQLWFGGVVVVVASGNRGASAGAMDYAPGNDPYVITVGCVDDRATKSYGDDAQCAFSSQGKTMDGYNKPEVMAPGRKIYAPLANATATIAQQFPERIAAGGGHIRLSGTSMSAPMVTGIIALLLEKHGTLTPNQIKTLVTQGGRSYGYLPQGSIQVDASSVIGLSNQPKAIASANQGLTPNTGINPATGTVNWGQTYWDQTYWDQTYWDQTYWDMGTTID